jgi:hypothetical protein
MSSALAHLAPEKGEVAAARSASPTTILVSQVRCSNGSVLSLRMLPVDARHLWLNLGVALGELPAMPATDEDEDADQGVMNDDFRE